MIPPPPEERTETERIPDLREEIFHRAELLRQDIAGFGDDFSTAEGMLREITDEELAKSFADRLRSLRTRVDGLSNPIAVAEEIIKGLRPLGLEKVDPSPDQPQ